MCTLCEFLCTDPQVDDSDDSHVWASKADLDLCQHLFRGEVVVQVLPQRGAEPRCRTPWPLLGLGQLRPSQLGAVPDSADLGSFLAGQSGSQFKEIGLVCQLIAKSAQDLWQASTGWDRSDTLSPFPN